MHPVLFHIGPYTLYAYGVFLAAGFLAAAAWAAHEARLRGLDEGRIALLLFAAVFGATVGGRMGYVLLHPAYFWENPQEMLLLWRGGLLYATGALMGGACILAAIGPRHPDLWRWLDALASAAALGEAVGRIGCLFAGCGFGPATTLPWGIRLVHPEAAGPLFVPMHPTPIYFSLLAICLFAVLCAGRDRLSRQPGTAAAVFLIVWGGVQAGLLPLQAASSADTLYARGFAALFYAAAGVGIFKTRRHHVDRGNSSR
ncbi:prolipoprotein diacylglyceryl transferase [Thermodesulfomicrobium sp. WS]|uniref:prolipoprotein diacylglyceryl transferase n=1 Tax=Thermodesulfomicrobium sp. WS TaxID=3004129 RepID=UPI0024921C81|nr:prolipoprotein diacylglyceryl transferase family protein [Thermodesulfomicrobium sp. WS]BDV01696.1 prolipoprotein diacylglyceryl transferase [Thermodesulfomicrobium sp. WS]